MAFLDDKYLLKTETALALFHRVKDLPVIDPHNHADVKEIARNKPYKNVWQLFAATDHYVWEVMRKRAVDEQYITGRRSAKEKWFKLCDIFPMAVGNPVYEWIHLDLRRYLHIDKVLCPENAEYIWDEANKVLQYSSMCPQELLKRINVEVMCSTDDPVDLLDNHLLLEKTLGRKMIRPTWRPDKAMKIFAPAWRGYMDEVQQRFNIKFKTIEDLFAALKLSHDYFAERGCVATDHGIELPLPALTETADADKVFRKAMKGSELTMAEINCFMSCFLTRVCEYNAEKDWVTQLHLGAVRDVRDTLFASLGPDVGGDIANIYQNYVPSLCSFLNHFDERLKVVLYCLDPGQQMTLATVSRAFGAKVNLGSAWWLNDSPIGMRRQLEHFGTVDVLANFAGMVSDSRKLLSYGSRFEMFRRVLSDTLADMVELRQASYTEVEKLAVYMCYERPKELFGF